MIDANSVVNAAQRLQRRIGQRFKNSELVALAKAVEDVAQESGATIEWFSRPVWGFRVLMVLLPALLIGWSANVFQRSNLDFGVKSGFELVQFIESAVNDVIFMSIAVFFFVRMEQRVRRNRAVKAIHVLRGLAHSVDLDQLLKDPDRLSRGANMDTSDSPKEKLNAFELGRYLAYCSELLSLIGKISVVYSEHLQDSEALNQAQEVDKLAAMISQKIWLKRSVLAELSE